jgi:rRNA maturation endonuclease Nob1
MSQFFLGSVWGRSHMGSDTGVATVKAERASRSAEAVEHRLERALLTMEAMWSLLRDRLGSSDVELVARIVEIDLSDGILDGKVRRPALDCHACKRKIPRRFPRCMYCGVEVQHDPFS